MTLPLERFREKERQIKKDTFKLCFLVLFALAAWWGLLLAVFAILKKSPDSLKDTNSAFTSTFQYLIVGWTLNWMWPYFRRMEAKQDLALEIGIESMRVIQALGETIILLRNIISLVHEDEIVKIRQFAIKVVDFFGKSDTIESVRAKIKSELASVSSDIEKLILARIDMLLGNFFGGNRGQDGESAEEKKQ